MQDPETETQETTIAKEKLKMFFPDEIKKGAFSNNVFISHTPEEFILDFVAMVPQSRSVVSRIILTPSHTKRLANALISAVVNYEKKFGDVPENIEEIS